METDIPDFKEVLKNTVNEIIQHERKFFNQKIDTIINMLEEAEKRDLVYSSEQVIKLFSILKERKYEDGTH